MIIDRLGAKPMVLHLPIGVESDFVGMVDLVQMKSITWKDEALGAEFTVGDIPDDMKKRAEEYHHTLVEMAVELDDKAMEAYLEGKQPDVDHAEEADPQGHHRRDVRAGAVRLRVQDKGVQPMRTP